jgi:hypothetical protein
MKLEGVRTVYPLDKLLGLSDLPFKMTVGAMLKVSEIAQDSKSYKHATSRLKKENGIKIDTRTVMEVTNHTGRIAFEHELNVAKNIYKDIIDDSNWTAFPQNKEKGVLYILVDGAMVNTRQKDETTNSGYKENKLGLVYNAKDVRVKGRIPEEGEKKKIRHEILKKEYTAFVGSVEEFKVLLFGCAIKNGYGKYDQTVLLSDGATWIRNMKNELFPDAQQILDMYHLKEKIWNFSKTYFNEDKSRYTPWAEEMCDKMEESQYQHVLDEVIKMENKIHMNGSKLSTYIINNIDCIDYATYVSKDYIIGSGAIESANKSILQYRLKQAGMRWNVDNAQNIVTLRAKMESNKWFSDVVLPVRKKYNIKTII